MDMDIGEIVFLQQFLEFRIDVGLVHIFPELSRKHSTALDPSAAHLRPALFLLGDDYSLVLIYRKGG